MNERGKEMAEKKKVTYAEPTDYIPKAVRKKFGLGEFNKEETPKKRKPAKKK